MYQMILDFDDGTNVNDLFQKVFLGSFSSNVAMVFETILTDMPNNAKSLQDNFKFVINIQKSCNNCNSQTTTSTNTHLYLDIKYLNDDTNLETAVTDFLNPPEFKGKCKR